MLSMACGPTPKFAASLFLAIVVALAGSPGARLRTA
jgi:hypothetical protein